MKALQTKKFVGQKSISDAAIPVQSQIKSRPFIVNSAPQSQELTQKPEEAKKQGFNFAQIPIFPGMRPAMPEMLQPKQAKETLKDLPEVNLAPSSGGQPMPKLVQQKMETSFGTSLANVRIHEGSQNPKKIGALAYTQGENIHFSPGQYQPTTESGQKLLGHEIAHVEQQRAGRVTAPQSKGVAINANPQLETEADVLGAKAARGESAQVTEARSFGLQRMPAQGHVMQCMRDGKQSAESSEQEEDAETEIGAVLEQAYTGILNQDLANAPPEELAEIARERDNLLAPVAAEQILISSQPQEQAESSSSAQNSTSEQAKAASNSQSEGEKPQMSEEKDQIVEGIDQGIKESQAALPQVKELTANVPKLEEQLQSESKAGTSRVTPRQRQKPQISSIPQPMLERLRGMDDTARERALGKLEEQYGESIKASVIKELSKPPIRSIPQPMLEQLLGMDNRARERAFRQLEERYDRESIENLVMQELRQREQQQRRQETEMLLQSPESPPLNPAQDTRRVRQQQDSLPIESVRPRELQQQWPTRVSSRPERTPMETLPDADVIEPILPPQNTVTEIGNQQVVEQQQDSVSIEPVRSPVPEQREQLPQRVRRPRERRRVREPLMLPMETPPDVDVIESVLPPQNTVTEIESQEVEENIPEERIQEQTPKEEATWFQKTTRSIGKSIETTKDSRKQLAAGIKQHETYADLTKILGQDSPKTDLDQIYRQNLPANAKSPMTLLKPLPAGTPEEFSNDAAAIGMTRDIAKATGALLTLPENLKKLKDGYRDNKKPLRKRIADVSGGAGEIISAITYNGIVISQAYRGIQHHVNKAPGQNTNFASGLIAAIKQGGKLGPISSITQGGLVGGTSIPFDVGKAGAGIFTTIPKVMTTVEAGYNAYQKDNFGGYEYWLSGLKNLADLSKSVGGAIKDVASFANNISVVGAEGTQIVAGGGFAPSAGMVLGGLEIVQGSDDFRKAYKNYRNPSRRPEDIPLNKFKKEQKDKMIRAGIDATLGAITLGGGIVGFTAGPQGLLAATIMGASVGAFQIGEWGIRKLKQKVLGNRQIPEVDLEQGYELGATRTPIQ
ncbi:DUF4157 domain-containing protein [Nostoc sp. C117]|uniref:eCIS core domain-containing protein n=1 Tax=Nostoc sp. C117 TaxID=3349875 RepID=UPI00370D1985